MQNLEQVIRQIDRLEDIWWDYYHNSPMREGLLSWYDWKEGASILEWNPGRGALTGLLSRRGREVICRTISPYQTELLRERFSDTENIRLVPWDKLEDEGIKFDYIVAVNPLPERPQDWEVPMHYEIWRSFLKPDGTLLFAVNNCFGIQKAIGVRNARGWEASRTGLLDGLRNCFSEIKLYDVFPDFIFPQMIHTDQRPPDYSLIERLRLYARNIYEVTQDDALRYRDAAKDGLLYKMAGSFLAECTNGSRVCDVMSATLTLDREEHALTTRVRSCGLVEKAAMNSRSAEHLRETAENLNRLRARGVRTVPMQPEGAVMRMPFIDAPVLTAYLKNCIQKDPAEFLAVTDRFYQTILNSSERTDVCDAGLAQYGQRDWGPLLETAYIEMTPLNCFYSGDDFLFFDQEYVEHNWPAKHILFRGLTHLYYFDDIFEQFIPLEEIKERYQLSELWEVFTEMEETFLRKVRGHGKNDAFHSILTSGLSNPYQGIWPGDSLGRREVYDLFAMRGDKKIVLWGTGHYFSIFMDRYGDLFPISFAVDSNPNLWGACKAGVQILSPESLRGVQARVIVTCRAAADIAARLAELGQADIRIFNADRNDECGETV